MTDREAIAVLGLTKAPGSERELTAAYTRQTRRVQAAIHFPRPGTKKEQLVEELQRLEEARAILTSQVASGAPQSRTHPAASPPSPHQASSPPVPRYRPARQPRPPYPSSNARPGFTAKPRPQSRPAPSQAASNMRSASPAQQSRPRPSPPSRSAVVETMITLGLLLKALAQGLWFVCIGPFRLFWMLPPPARVGIVLAAVAGLGGWYAFDWWSEAEAAINTYTWPAAEVYCDGRYVYEAPNAKAVALSAGKHEFRCVSRRGEEYTFATFLLPSRCYILEIDLERQKHIVRRKE